MRGTRLASGIESVNRKSNDKLWAFTIKKKSPPHFAGAMEGVVNIRHKDPEAGIRIGHCGGKCHNIGTLKRDNDDGAEPFHGNDIEYGYGEYDPQSKAGRCPPHGIAPDHKRQAWYAAASNGNNETCSIPPYFNNCFIIDRLSDSNTDDPEPVPDRLQVGAIREMFRVLLL